MSGSSRPVITAAVEGIIDEVVARRLIHHVGALPDAVIVKQGKPNLLASLRGYNQAARHSRWLVLLDLDHDADCAPEAKQDWLEDTSDGLCLRVAVRQVEAWLLADRYEIARFLSVSQARVPAAPDALPQPKRTMVELAARSRQRRIREGIVPSQGSRRVVGAEYTTLVVEYITRKWRPQAASSRSDSLRRCLVCLEHLARD